MRAHDTWCWLVDMREVLETPNDKTMAAALRVLRYLRYTKELGLRWAVGADAASVRAESSDGGASTTLAEVRQQIDALRALTPQLEELVVASVWSFGAAEAARLSGLEEQARGLARQARTLLSTTSMTEAATEARAALEAEVSRFGEIAALARSAMEQMQPAGAPSAATPAPRVPWAAPQTHGTPPRARAAGTGPS